MRSRGRRLLLALALLVLAAVAGTVSLVALRHDEKTPRLQAGSTAPPLTGAAVRGGRVNIERLRGHVAVLSFLNSRAEATLEGDPSRAQIVFLRSMQRQHARFGLRVIVVDASALAGAGRPTRDDLVNYTYDWNLDSAIAVLADDGTLARRFGVHKPPTTFLIGTDGVVRYRWDGFAPAARLDLAIRQLEDRSPTG
jgi:AhpC/TSA family